MFGIIIFSSRKMFQDYSNNESQSSENELSSSTSLLSDGTGYQTDGVIGPSMLCCEAKKKTSLPIDNMELNPSSSDSSVSGS